MIKQPLTESIPIHQDEQGQLRVGKSRILLDLVIYAYRQGNIPETIIDNYPTLMMSISLSAIICAIVTKLTSIFRNKKRKSNAFVSMISSIIHPH